MALDSATVHYRQEYLEQQAQLAAIKQAAQQRQIERANAHNAERMAAR